MFVLVCFPSSRGLSVDSSPALLDLSVSSWETEQCLKYCQTLIPTWKMVARIYYLIEIILLWESGERTFIHKLVYCSRALKGIKYLLQDQKAGSFPFLLPAALWENLFFIFLFSNDAVHSFFLDSWESVGLTFHYGCCSQFLLLSCQALASTAFIWLFYFSSIADWTKGTKLRPWIYPPPQCAPFSLSSLQGPISGPGWPWHHFLAHAGFEFSILLPQSSEYLELQACRTRRLSHLILWV